MINFLTAPNSTSIIILHCAIRSIRYWYNSWSSSLHYTDTGDCGRRIFDDWRKGRIHSDLQLSWICPERPKDLRVFYLEKNSSTTLSKEGSKNKELLWVFLGQQQEDVCTVSFGNKDHQVNVGSALKTSIEKREATSGGSVMFQTLNNDIVVVQFEW